LTISLNENGTVILEFGYPLDSEVEDVVAVSEEEASVLWRTMAAFFGMDVWRLLAWFCTWIGAKADAPATRRARVTLQLLNFILELKR